MVFVIMVMGIGGESYIPIHGHLPIIYGMRTSGWPVVSYLSLPPSM